MNQYYKLFVLLEKKINTWSLRERVLFFCAVIGIVYYVWQVLAFDTIEKAKNRITESITISQEQIAQLTEQVNAATQLLQLHPKTELSNRIEVLRQEKEQYENSITALTNQLIHPKDMTKLLEEILEQNKDLALIKMENMAEEPVFKQNGSAAKELQKIQVYKHGLKLEVSGTYFATQRFLQALEKLPWKLLWDELHYKVQDYPVATVSIVIYTLSLQKSCLGM